MRYARSCWRRWAVSTTEKYKNTSTASMRRGGRRGGRLYNPRNQTTAKANPLPGKKLGLTGAVIRSFVVFTAAAPSKGIIAEILAVLRISCCSLAKRIAKVHIEKTSAASPNNWAKGLKSRFRFLRVFRDRGCRETWTETKNSWRARRW